jgi:DNA modification methylase
MQFDIADRVIAQMSEPGELVFDPFSGLGTVPLRALRLGRRGLGVELSPTYHDDAVHWLRRQELQQLTPSLFSLIEEEAEPEEEEAL